MAWLENKHRVLKELNKRISRGQSLHFLTGDGIGDNFLYDVREGVKNLPDTLRDYFLRQEGADNFKYFIHVTAKANFRCSKSEDGVIEEIKFDDIINPPKRGGALNRKADNAQKDNAEQVANQNASGNQDIQRLEEAIKEKNAPKFFIFLEKLEWIANLYDSQPDLTWISKIENWSNLRNVMIVVTIKDMEMATKYGFPRQEIFVGYPSAEEIRNSYLRYILRHTDYNYNLNMAELDEISHGMSVGEKTLHSCLEVLRRIVKAHPDRLLFEDFKEIVERGIEEKVAWEKVRLEDNIKTKIMTAVEAFKNSTEENRARSGMIFSGPPGTGKTLIAKSLASEMQCYFLAPTLAELKGEYIGQSSAKIKNVFDKARANEPTIIFIDEADTVFPSRALGSDDKDSYTMDMVNQFLQEIDGAKTGLQKIFVIAATNRPEYIDEAIKSRLGDPEEIPLPSPAMRKLIFEDNFSTKDMPFELTGKRFEDLLITKSEKMSGRDIMNFVKTVKEAAGKAHITIGDNVETQELIEATFEHQEEYFIRDTTARGIFTRSNVIRPRDNRKRLSDIIGYENQKRRIIWQTEYIEATAEQKAEYARMKVEPQKGVILYGPPGNGKTELAEAVAGEKDFYFFKILSKDFASGFPSEQIKRLDDIFTELERFSKLTDKKGIVLFFDEFDSLASVNNLNSVVRGSLLNYFSDENHLRGKDSKILFIAATNNIDEIDEAITRKGRIDAHIFMDNPTQVDAINILNSFIAAENIVETDNNFIADAYRRLFEEKQTNHILERFKTLNWQDLVRDEFHAAVQREIESQRPSGADLKIFYREMKEIAFRLNKRRVNKLFFDNEVLNQRFIETGAV